MRSLEISLLSGVFRAALVLGPIGFVSPASASAVLLFAAGGGGGAPWESTPGGNGVGVPTGADGGGAAKGAGGVGGFGGQGGSAANGSGGGGGGWYSQGGAGGGGGGAGGLSTPAFSGGVGYGLSGHPTADGGFGGGGGGGGDGGGGGGGFSGGGGGGDELGGATYGGGGGSFVAPSVTGATIAAGTNGVNNGSNQAPGQNGFVYIGAALFSYSGSIVDYVIPATGDYDLLVAGAQGGPGLSKIDAYGGYGSVLSGHIDLLAGTELEIIVGGAGVGNDGTFTPPGPGGVGGGDTDIVSGGGGGGSFVAEISVPTVLAVPEPPVWALAATGFLGLALLRQHRRGRIRARA